MWSFPWIKLLLSFIFKQKPKLPILSEVNLRSRVGTEKITNFLVCVPPSNNNSHNSSGWGGDCTRSHEGGPCGRGGD